MHTCQELTIILIGARHFQAQLRDASDGGRYGTWKCPELHCDRPQYHAKKLKMEKKDERMKKKESYPKVRIQKVLK